MKYFFIIFVFVIKIVCIDCVSYDRISGSFDGLNIVLENRLNASDCPQILKNLKNVLTSTSKEMYDRISGRFGKINVRIPSTWTDDHCYTEGHIREHQPFQSKGYDLYVGPYDRQDKGKIWTQQSEGCAKEGDFIYFPYQPLKKNANDLSSKLFRQWLRYYYGLFTNDVMSNNVTSGSLQDSFCLGASAFSMISESDSRLIQSKVIPRISEPEFVISREIGPKYVIVLENSLAMDFNNTWDLIRTALKKFINEDIADENAQVGLVLFNEAANIARTVTKIGPKNEHQRTGISVHIKNKYFLSHKANSCVRCGVIKAIEALQTSGNTIGANIILISQGHLNVMSREDEKELKSLSKKHELRLHTVPLIHERNNVSILFESLSYETGGISFFIQSKKDELSIYMSLLDALREIRARSETNGPVLVHEQKIKNSMKLEEEGSFYVDEHISPNSEFNLYTMGSNKHYGYVKTMKLKDNRGHSYALMNDEGLREFHYLSLFDVPFEKERNMGMLWNYEFDKIYQPLETYDNYVVQFTSSPKMQHESIQVKFYTNKDSHSFHVNETHPLKLFVEVKLDSFPVIDADVKLVFRVTKHQTSEDYAFEMNLYDNGNGDPDVRGDDGVYSRYFTDFQAGEGRYDVEVHVSNERGTARLPASNYTISRKNVKLGFFSRIVKGDSFRIMSLAPFSKFSPARILDLSAFVEEDRVLLSWTAPGEVLDHGRVITYKIFSSELSSSFYKRNRQVLTEIAATQRSGVLEKIPLEFKLIQRDSYIAVAAVSKSDRMGELSNVVHVKLPENVLRETAPIYNSQAQNNHVHSEDISVKSDKVLFYVLFAIIAVVLICILAVLAILKKYRNVKSEDDQCLDEDPMDDISVIDVTDLMVNQTKTEPVLTAFQKYPNHSILKNTYEECNCHEVYNNSGLVINPSINYASLNSNHYRQEPIYQNQQEIYANQSINYPIYSVVNKPKNVRIQIRNELTDEDAETENTEEDRCSTPSISNAYLENSFEHNTTPKLKDDNKLTLTSPVYNSTPNGKVRTITQV